MRSAPDPLVLSLSRAWTASREATGAAPCRTASRCRPGRAVVLAITLPSFLTSGNRIIGRHAAGARPRPFGAKGVGRGRCGGGLRSSAVYFRAVTVLGGELAVP